jgi:hypothetical protein
MTDLSTNNSISGSANASTAEASFSGLQTTDNATTADTVASLLKDGRQGEAVVALDAARQGQPAAVQDALDRMVSARLDMSLNPSPSLGIQSLFASPADIGNTLRRINDAGNNPPVMPDTNGLTTQQKYEVYSSIVETRGTQAAEDALANGDRVIVGLRVENNTLTNNGRGVYDDRLAVIARSTDGSVHVDEFNRVSTEPTAQYDGNQSSNPDISANFRRAEGSDITGDGIPELGRLAEGTVELVETTHRNPSSAGTNFSLRPSATAVNNGAGGVQRDSNHDGLFDANDPGGTVDLNNTFKIHSGSRTNTDSAGCTTLHPADYSSFHDAVTADASQTRWQYVLSSTTP